MLIAKGKCLRTGGLAVGLLVGLVSPRLGAVDPPAQEATKKAAAPQTPASSVSGPLARLQLEMTQREWLQVQSDLRKTRLELSFWEKRDKVFANLPIPDSAVDERVNLDPLVTRHLTRLSELRDQIASVERVSAPGKAEASLQDLRRQVADTEKTVELLRKQLRPEITKQLREKAYDEYKGKLTQYREQIELEVEMAKVLKADIDRLSQAVPGGSAGSTDQRLSNLERDVREIKEAIEELKKRK